jgi:hypothetical protein
MKLLLALIVSVLTLVACGGNTPEPTPESFTIQITPGAALLTKSGETKALTAKVLNSSGNAVDKPITWRSSNPNDVQISSDGVITALKDLGSSQITASVGAVQSDAAVVTIAQPITGAVLVPDADIVSALPIALDPTTIGEMGSRYVVQIKNAPTVGSLLISSEGKAVAGKVVAVAETNGVFDVTLELVPLHELFRSVSVQINQPIDTVATLESAAKQSRVTGEFDAPFGFKCKVEATGISNGEGLWKVSPDVKIEPKLQIKPDIKLHLFESEYIERKVQVGIVASGKLTGLLKAQLGLKGKGECARAFRAIPIPVNGYLSWFFMPEVVPSIAFGGEAEATFSLFEIGYQAELTLNANLGFTVSSADDWIWANRGTTEFKGEPKYTFGADIPFRLKGKMGAYLKGAFRFSSPVASVVTQDDVAIALVEAKAGGYVSAEMATIGTQASSEPSKYALGLEFGVGFPVELQNNIAGFVKRKLGWISKVTDKLSDSMTKAIQAALAAGLSKEFPLGESPVALGKLEMDKATFKKGDKINFKFGLDASKIKFLGTYNVDKVIVYQLRNGIPFEIVEQVASEDQIYFELNWAAEADGEAGKNFFAFVIPKILSTETWLEYKLGRFEAASSTPTGTLEITYTWESDAVGMRVVNGGTYTRNDHAKITEKYSYILENKTQNGIVFRLKHADYSETFSTDSFDNYGSTPGCPNSVNTRKDVGQGKANGTFDATPSDNESTTFSKNPDGKFLLNKIGYPHDYLGTEESNFTMTIIGTQYFSTADGDVCETKNNVYTPFEFNYIFTGQIGSWYSDFLPGNFPSQDGTVVLDLSQSQGSQSVTKTVTSGDGIITTQKYTLDFKWSLSQ